MKRLVVLTVAAVAAAAPAAAGVLGNQAFASTVPVRAATSTTSESVASVVKRSDDATKAGVRTKVDDNPGASTRRHGRGQDDRRGHRQVGPTGDDHGDHHGDHRSSGAASATIVTMTAQPVSREAEPGDDHGRRHGGHGADDTRADDHGRHGDDDAGGRHGDDDGGRHGGHDDGPHHT